MSSSDIQQGRRQAMAVVLGQGLLGAIVAIACLAVWGPRAGVSALLGAGIGIAATSLMAFAMLRHGEGANPQRVAWSFFSGWVVKVAFTVALLVVATTGVGRWGGLDFFIHRWLILPFMLRREKQQSSGKQASKK